jgi:hypothetical protein
MRSLRLAVAGEPPQNLRESGASRVLDRLLLALALPLALLLPSARRTLQLKILVGIDLPASMGRRVLFFFRELSITETANAGFGAWGGGEFMQLLVDELDPELQPPVDAADGDKGRSIAAIFVSYSISTRTRRCRLGYLVRSAPEGRGERESRAYQHVGLRGRRRMARLLATCHRCRALTAIISECIRSYFVFFEYIRKARWPCQPVGSIWVKHEAACYGRGLIASKSMNREKMSNMADLIIYVASRRPSVKRQCKNRFDTQ